jgi:hypothetical protein
MVHASQDGVKCRRFLESSLLSGCSLALRLRCKSQRWCLGNGKCVVRHNCGLAAHFCVSNVPCSLFECWHVQQACYEIQPPGTAWFSPTIRFDKYEAFKKAVPVLPVHHYAWKISGVISWIVCLQCMQILEHVCI